MSSFDSAKGPSTQLRFEGLPAAAAFEETYRGSLGLGKLADFVVLDRDPLAVPPREILSAKVLATFVGGAEAR